VARTLSSALLPYATLVRSHLGGRHVGIDLAAPGDARARQGVLRHHRQLGRAALPKLGLERAAHAAEDLAWLGLLARIHRDRGARSEEHTSELQSRENLVCR